MGSKLSLKEKEWFHQSLAKNKAGERKPLCYLSSKLFYPPTSALLIVFGV